VIDQVVRQPEHRRRLDDASVGSQHAHLRAHSRSRGAALAFDQPSDGVGASDHFGLVVDLDVG